MNTERKKLSFFFILAGLALSCLALFYLFSSYTDAKNKVKAQLSNDSFLISEWIRGSFIASDYVLKDVISQVPLTELTYPAPDPELHKKRKAFLEKKRLTLPKAILIGLFDKNCMITHSNSKDGFDASGRDYCQIMMNEPERQTYISTAYIANNGKINVTQTRKFNIEPGYEGMAAIGVNLDFFSGLIAPLTYGEGSHITILDTDMKILARKPERKEFIGRKIKERNVEELIQKRLTEKFMEVESPVDGIDRLYVVRKVDDMPFVIVIGEPHHVWQAQWRQRALVVIIALTAIMVLIWFNLKSNLSLVQQKEALALLANTDPLVDACNRRHFYHRSNIEIDRARRYSRKLSAIVLDLDLFKQMNDSYGHSFGDLVLVTFARICGDELRDMDLLCRLGGDEFVILLPETDRPEAKEVAKRIYHTIRTSPLTTASGDQVNIQCSMGIATLSDSDLDIDDLLHRADESLYKAKERGRNQFAT